MKIETRIEITATPATVWKVLTDFEKYPEWNPFITTISGPTTLGSRLAATIGGMKISPVVLKFNQNRQLTWQGKLLSSWLFVGKHDFQINKIASDKCEFLHSEIFSGALLPLLKNKLQTDTRAGFEAMNLALKNRAEAISTGRII